MPRSSVADRNAGWWKSMAWEIWLQSWLPPGQETWQGKTRENTLPSKKNLRYARGKGTSSGPSYPLVGDMLGSLEGTIAYLHICLGSSVLLYPPCVCCAWLKFCLNSRTSSRFRKGLEWICRVSRLFASPFTPPEDTGPLWKLTRGQRTALQWKIVEFVATNTCW